jgi:hypothetical protein
MPTALHFADVNHIPRRYPAARFLIHGVFKES